MTINIDSVNLGTDPVAACLLPGWKQQGQLTEMSRSGSMMSETRTDYYGYNDRNELVSGTKDTAATNLTEYAYQYDDIGNRIISLDLGTNRTYTANALNQYTSISNSALSATPREIFTPTFDLDMRPRQRRRVARRSEATEPRSGRKRPRNQTLVQTATGDWQVAYNGENRPVLWECGSTNIVMKFDRMGRRVEYVEMVSGVTNTHHRFVYDGYLCIQRLNALANNAAEISFVWDPTEPVATRPLVFQRQGGWSFFYTHDGNKNVSEVVSFQQARGIPAHYEYAPFGTVTATTNATTITAFDVRTLNPFRFSSEYADDTLGLVYYNYRHYEPVIGRWMSRDPKNERVSLYEAMLQDYIWCNNHFFETDRLGLECTIYRFMGHYAGMNAAGANDIRLLVQQQAIDDCDAMFSISCHMDEFLIAATNSHPNVVIPPNWPREGALDEMGRLQAYNIYQVFQSSQTQIDGLVSKLSEKPCCCKEVIVKNICDAEMKDDIDKFIRLTRGGVGLSKVFDENPCGKEEICNIGK